MNIKKLFHSVQKMNVLRRNQRINIAMVLGTKKNSSENGRNKKSCFQGMKTAFRKYVYRLCYSFSFFRIPFPGFFIKQYFTHTDVFWSYLYTLVLLDIFHALFEG